MKQIVVIENKILTIRNQQVMLDRDLAELYQVETKRLNEAVKRNTERFPERFRFQLTDKELNKLVANCDRFAMLKHSSSNPYAFTEQGVSMLSAVLRSDVAVQVSIKIMDAFVEMRKILTKNQDIFARLDRIELKQLETDQKFEKVFKALENKNIKPTQGVFFDGQIFDAYEFVSKIIRSATKSIILIDNYIDESTLTHLAKKEKNIKAILFTKNINKQLNLDIKKVNEQYGNFEVKKFNKSHDRFLIIDNKEVYHLGASLKDLGKKWFAFSKMDKNSVETILKAIENE